MFGIPAYLYRLVPANPILLRVVSVGGKRRRDLLVRCAYLGLLIFLVIFALFGSDIGGGDLDKLSRTSTDIFRNLSYLQLALVSLLAPIFTAGAITQEKDSQTYDILLATPLTNGQIVLGTLLSRLFFVFALLVSGIPVFSITQIFGGVAFGDVLMSCGIAAVTALVTGALAVAIATFKVGTRRTIFSFYMLIVVYLVGLFLLDGLDFFKPGVLDPNTGNFTDLGATSWLTGVHPFLALRTILDPVAYRPPTLSQLEPALRAWPLSWYFTHPATFFVSAGTFLSLVLVLPSIALLRRMAQSTLSFKGWLARKLSFLPGVRPPGNRKPRGVWNNPIAWREAKTKASATKAGLLRYAFILAGLAGAITICVFYATVSETPKRFISPGNYNAAAGTLLIEGDNAGTYSIRPGAATITLDGNPATADVLEGYYAIASPPVFSTPGGVRTLSSLDLRPVGRRLGAAEARRFLLGMVFLEVAVILLIVTNAAASTVTREKEDGTLDLLLSTPITSRYYIWGKLRGLVSFALPLIVVPTVSCLVFILYDFASGAAGRGAGAGGVAGGWLVLPEALLLVPALLVVLVAFASIVGMNLSLRQKTTVRAVMISLAVVIGLFAVLGWCGYGIVTSGNNEVGLVIGSFSPLTVIMLLIDPLQYGGGSFAGGADPSKATTARVVVALFSLAACGAYAAAVWAMYKSMVKNFDMTIRRQQR